MDVSVVLGLNFFVFSTLGFRVGFFCVFYMGLLNGLFFVGFLAIFHRFLVRTIVFGGTLRSIYRDIDIVCKGWGSIRFVLSGSQVSTRIDCRHELFGTRALRRKGTNYLYARKTICLGIRDIRWQLGVYCGTYRGSVFLGSRLFGLPS